MNTGCFIDLMAFHITCVYIGLIIGMNTGCFIDLMALGRKNRPKVKTTHTTHETLKNGNAERYRLCAVKMKAVPGGEREDTCDHYCKVAGWRCRRGSTSGHVDRMQLAAGVAAVGPRRERTKNASLGLIVPVAPARATSQPWLLHLGRANV